MPEHVWIPTTWENLSQDKVRVIKSVLAEIPELPVFAKRIIELATDDNLDPRELAEVASSDPALVSKILIMVNSSYYGLNRKIDNLRLAIVLLGFNEVRKIAIRRGFSNVPGTPSENILYNIIGLLSLNS